MFQRHSSRIPIELVECVIDHLRGNMASLAACSSVSRDWYPHSHIVLYASICARSPSGYSDLLWLAHHNQHVRSDLSHTRELFIVGGSECKPHYATTMLLRFANLLDHLTAIALRSCLQLPIPPAFTTSLQQFKSVTCLELSDFVVYNVHELLRTASALPSLHRLALIRGRLIKLPGTDSDEWVQRTAFHISQRLRELDLDDLQAGLLASIVDLLQSIYSFRQTRLLVVDQCLESIEYELAVQGLGRTLEPSATTQQVIKVDDHYTLRQWQSTRPTISLGFIRTGLFQSVRTGTYVLSIPNSACYRCRRASSRNPQAMALIIKSGRCHAPFISSKPPIAEPYPELASHTLSVGQDKLWMQSMCSLSVSLPRYHFQAAFFQNHGRLL